MHADRKIRTADGRAAQPSTTRSPSSPPASRAPPQARAVPSTRATAAALRSRDAGHGFHTVGRSLWTSRSPGAAGTTRARRTTPACGRRDPTGRERRGVPRRAGRPRPSPRRTRHEPPDLRRWPVVPRIHTPDDDDVKQIFQGVTSDHQSRACLGTTARSRRDDPGADGRTPDRRSPPAASCERSADHHRPPRQHRRGPPLVAAVTTGAPR